MESLEGTLIMWHINWLCFASNSSNLGKGLTSFTISS